RMSLKRLNQFVCISDTLGLNKLYRTLEADFIRVLPFRNAYELFVMQYVGTKSSDIDDDWLFFELTKVARHLKQFHCILQRDAFNKLARTQTCKLRFLATVVVRVLTDLNVGTEASKFGVNIFTGLGINTQFAAATNR